MTEFNYEEWLKDQFKSKVYEALTDIAYDYPDVSDELHEKAMREAVEWFMKKFYNE